MAIPLLPPSQLLSSLPQQWQLGLLALLPLLALSSFLLLTSRSSGSSATAKKGERLPPGPVQLPVLGSLHLLGPLPHRSFGELARQHGPVMLLRLGTVPTVVVSSAEAAQEVMKAHDVDCCSRPVSPGPKRLSYDLKNVAFAPYDEYWREMRKLFIVELLSMRRVKAGWYAREQQVDKLIGNLTRSGPKPVALNEHIFGLADGIIGTVAFGNIYGSEQFAHKQHFQHVLDEAMDMMASFSAEDFFPNAAGWLVDRLTGLVARRERIFKDLDAFFESVIDQHMDPARAKPENGGDLVDVLINLWKEHRGTLRFTRDHVKGIILDTFLGGIDTSSVTMLWAMSELIRKPRVLKKAQDEVRAVVGDKVRVEPGDVPKLTYLKMVVKETLRLHPPATLLLPRETMRHIKICGYDVPAKTRIFVNAWAIGRDPASWTDAEEFNPDRFEASDVDYNGAHFELVPFGAGRRICPGLAMGETNVQFTLANLLYCFDWALPEGMAAEDVSMEEAGGLTFHRKTPLVLVPTKYQQRAV
ncbi:4-hydroxyphenylacetaldehyde oxime monooxygenase-like [Phragmites australis]|uniref:4-hydroxyphenylacetaldehyde oxime monooxygenase-like n=1 Tax=Phragmites australis TaxID=29695 RepID=UPI002D78FA4D|nr:4-hydroxyphenylacetaldehyde oxime monooxygenase-like [Phragmites australis]